ncbi:MAG: hypothetical protein R3266_03225 [Gemmatimonadota bacterium]|nr:hypothetical protein [Gemmatimonadota bacterium]
MSEPKPRRATDRAPLRVGLMLDSYRQPAWVRRMIERIEAEPYADIVVIVRPAESSAGDVRGGWAARLSSYWRSRKYLLHALFGRLDRRREVTGPDAFEVSDVSDLLADVSMIEVSPRRTRFSDYFPDEDIAAVRDQDLDVLVRLGFRILRGDILRAARGGVWSFHHGDNRVNRGGPAGFWEVLLEWPCTGSILQVLNEDLDGGLVLDRSWASTHPVSVRANRNSYFWKSLSMLPRRLEQLHRLGHDDFFAFHESRQDRPGFYSQRLFLTPTNRELFVPMSRLYGRLLRRKVEQAFILPQWELRYRLGEGFGSSLWRMKRLVPPGDRFWADPHIVWRDGRAHVFLEEFLYDERRGRIAVLTFDEDGRPSEPVPVLERPYHLSYPCIFEYDDQLFMIPETSAARTIELYRCDAFPHRWSLERVIMKDLLAVDATILEHDGRWWMFVGIRENEGASPNDELFAFHAVDPVSGEWTPHRENPIVSDVRRARPGGSFIRWDGELYRPAQDCARSYGWGIRIQRVTRLTPTDYREEEVSVIEPAFSPEVEAVHTIAHAPGVTVIDARVRRRRPAR